MKLLMVARRYPPDVRSGTETVFENLYLRARVRHDVRLVAGFVRDRTLLPAEAVPVDLRGLSKARAWGTVGAAALREARRWRPDVVLSNCIEVPPLGAPTAVIVHDLNFGGGARGASSFIKASFYAMQARLLATVITVSAASAATLRSAGVPEGRIRLVHNGVDVSRFHPPLEEPAPLDQVHFAYPSRILPGKGQHHAIDALARLPLAYRGRVRLTVVGAGVDQSYIRRLKAQSEGLPVEIVTDVEDMAAYYRAADVVVYPTVMDEGFGFTAVEAMASGRPVIWFDQPSIREATGGIGIPVRRGDVDGLAAAMIRLIDSPEERRRIGGEGRRYAVDNLSWDRVWARYENILVEIAP